MSQLELQVKGLAKVNGLAIRSAWITTVATEGQSVEALKTTDILKNEHIAVDWTPFLLGPPVVEAALAKRLDVADMGSAPTLSLVSQNQSWAIVARGTVLEQALVVPNNSSIHSIAQLKGQKIAVSLGTSAEAYLIKMITDAGLRPDDFTLVNVTPPQNVEIIRAGTPEAWRDYAAVVVWDPELTLVEREGRAREIAVVHSPLYISMDKSLLDNRPKDAAAYLCSLKKAWAYYRRNRHQLDQLYIKDSGLKIDLASLKAIADNDPKVSGADDNISIKITQNEIDDLRATADVMKKRGRLSPTFDVIKSIKSDAIPANCQ